ncbi:MAG: Crp/Fnr family transcriptional regulator [Gemmatimonadaceae bacterium]|nr:Crp/Fnr family transcriptional regulator [Chitinophagaceae bacterium]
MPFTQLKTVIQQIYPLGEVEMEAMMQIWEPFSCKRKTILTRAGETEKYLYFVAEGLQRSFYLADDGSEATIVFTYAPSFSGLIDSFLTQTPSTCSLETLTTSKFLRTSWSQVNDLMNRYPPLTSFVLKATAFAIKGVLERQIEMQCFSAEKRLRSLLKRSPHVLQLIPHKYLASYLGIDAATFSKLLGSVRLV